MAKKNNTDASASFAGFLFQPERALLHLSQLKDRNHSISIEYVDDVSIHDEKGFVISTEQDKYSIAKPITFQDSSLDLWKTFAIWVDLLKQKKVSEKTIFICSTNKKISSESFLYVLPKYDIKKLAKALKTFLDKKKKALDLLNKKALAENKDVKNVGRTLKVLIKKIEFVKNELLFFKNVLSNIIIEDEQTNEKIKDQFLNQIQRQKDNSISDRIYEELNGWLINHIKHLWSKNKNAIITKEQFNERIEIINSSEVLNQLIFRTKNEIQKEFDDTIELQEIYSDSLFVRQIDSMERYKKSDVILDAINDFLCYEKEEMRIADKGTITSSDFQKFITNNEKRWKNIFISKVIKEPEKYSDEEKNKLAIDIYDETMKMNIKFKDIYEINISNRYIKTGSFHKLADIPEIGWHPNWEEKFNKNENEN